MHEAQTASYRQPLAGTLFTAADADERAAADKQRLKALGRRLRGARAELGLSVEYVAELTRPAETRVIGAERRAGR
ncbi:MAG: hypothetical protein QOC78_1785 [Solirubrobacteraceae bacterium]|nr:hypothetical protein [Solirubrobacteraceae bacterium]